MIAINQVHYTLITDDFLIKAHYFSQQLEDMI